MYKGSVLKNLGRKRNSSWNYLNTHSIVCEYLMPANILTARFNLLKRSLWLDESDSFSWVTIVCSFALLTSASIYFNNTKHGEKPTDARRDMWHRSFSGGDSKNATGILIPVAFFMWTFFQPLKGLKLQAVVCLEKMTKRTYAAAISEKLKVWTWSMKGLVCKATVLSPWSGSETLN